MTVLPLGVHSGEAEAKVNSLGNVSVTVTPVASCGPLFVMASV